MNGVGGLFFTLAGGMVLMGLLGPMWNGLNPKGTDEYKMLEWQHQQTQAELDRLRLEMQAYQSGVKDSQ